MGSFSRKDLFDAVWAQPLAHLATGLGVTSKVLQATCARHDIPVPSPAYWRAVAAGGDFAKPTLRPAVRPSDEVVEIPGAGPLPAPSRNAASAASPRPRPQWPAARPAVSAEVHPKRAASLASTHAAAPNPTAVPAPEPDPQPATELPAGRDPPPMLRATLRALDKAKPDAFGFVSVHGAGVVRTNVGLASRERATALLSSLADQAQALGHRLVADEGALRLEVAGEKIPFRLAEVPDHAPHLPTRAELADKARRLRWGDERDPWPQHDEVPSGRLAFHLEADTYTGLRKAWRDGKRQQIEGKVADILDAFGRHAAAIQERRREIEERDRRWAEEAAQRERVKAHERREARRGEFVAAIGAMLSEREMLSKVLGHVERAEDEEARLASIAAWVRGRLAELDARLSPTFLDISARHARIDFDEVAAAKAEASGWSYAPPIELFQWSIDEAENKATSVSALDWAAAASMPPLGAMEEEVQPPQ